MKYYSFDEMIEYANKHGKFIHYEFQYRFGILMFHDNHIVKHLKIIKYETKKTLIFNLTYNK